MKMDKILYCDSGMFPINDLNYLFDLTGTEKDVTLFQVNGAMNSVEKIQNTHKYLIYTEVTYDRIL